jgi:hypothetical protein
MTFVAIKMGRRQGGPSRTGVWRAHPAPLFFSRGQTEQTRNQKSGAGRNRRATQPPAHFHRNPRAAPSWLFFRVARSSRIDLDMLVVTSRPKRPVC